MLKAYVAPPVDEVRLLADAAAWVQAHITSWPDGVPDRTALQALTGQVGIDLATAIFYQALLASPQHGPFVCAVDRLPAAPWAGEAGATLLIAPALYYRELPQYGGDGAAIGAIAQACGFRTVTAPLLSKGSLSRNAALLAEALAGQAGPVILLSLSVGGGEVRLLLDRWAADPLLDKLAGWINVCGLVRGVPLADRLLRSPIRRVHARAICGAIGLDFELVRELDPAHALWQRP
ncbi:MAG TPA: hypothetical protein VNK95_03055, partial [Caldilineaceae bacterium]|nr:hypothetical protein [Caldilineaceae bacterium]